MTSTFLARNTKLLQWTLSACRRQKTVRRLNLHTFQLSEVQCYRRVALLAIEAFELYKEHPLQYIYIISVKSVYSMSAFARISTTSKYIHIVSY